MLAEGGVLGSVVDGVRGALVKLEAGVVSQSQVAVNGGMKLLCSPSLGSDLLMLQLNKQTEMVIKIPASYQGLANGKTIFRSWQHSVNRRLYLVVLIISHIESRIWINPLINIYNLICIILQGDVMCPCLKIHRPVSS